MRLSIKSLVITMALLWCGCVLALGLLNLVWPSYGAAFLHAMSSVYPGFHANRTLLDVLVGTGYALVDGAVAGMLFGWLYNTFAPSSK